jgi:hypothetical protein
VFLTGTADFTFTRTGDQYGIDSGGNLVKSTTDVAAFIDGEGVLLEGARTNIVTAQNVDQTVLTGYSKTGDAAATMTLVDDSTKINSAGLGNISDGQVVKLDNSAGVGAAFILVAGNPANTSAHSYSMYARIDGVVLGKLSDANIAGATNFTNTDYVRIENTQATATVGANGRLTVTANAGAVVYFILSQTEDADFVSSEILNTSGGGSVSRSATSLTRAWPFPANGISGQIKATVNFDEADDKGSDVILFEASDGTTNNYLRITFDQTNDQIHFTKRVSAGTEVVASTIATNLNYAEGDQLNIRFRANSTDGISLEVDSETRVDVSTGDGTTDWTTLMDQIEIHPDFVAVESHRIWNESKSNSFLGNLV